MPSYSLSVSEKLKAKTHSGELQADPVQLEIARRLDRIRKRTDPIRGLYIHGSVGRGKTMLMDMFFNLAPVARKRRAHFHEFMADVHNRIHAHRQKLKSGETRQADPVPPVADELVAEAELLCFDEFTVTDIADAMILSRFQPCSSAAACLSRPPMSSRKTSTVTA
jgi:cell division protein ZapE